MAYTSLLIVLSLLLVIVLGYASAIVLLYFRVKHHYQRKQLRFYRLSVYQLWQFYLEIVHAVVVMSYWLVFKSNRNGRHRLVDKTQPAVLCIHGFHMNGSCFWGLRQALERQGMATFSVNLGRPYVDPKKYVDSLHTALEESFNSHQQQPVHLLAHSMGGLVCRMLLQHYPEDIHRIKSVITLGTPHHGTQAVGDFTLPWLKEMFHPHSPLLHQLPEFSDMAPQLPVMTLASVNDLVVFPIHRALLNNTTQVRLCTISHMGLLMNPRVTRRIVRWLNC
ncbi:alpha/beta fold hydrolase [Lacimicrobium sp. SS2-24]|uniref:esterase/lipase family protein n=1 Tax=Lacimicrobium sp. SS2-24 TaxID=2005569 RepID=UPI000B4B1A04|nr:alpha/beta fold hydrolase [Lacimicrobium sp. SS2-24]